VPGSGAAISDAKTVNATSLIEDLTVHDSGLRARAVAPRSLSTCLGAAIPDTKLTLT